MVKLKSVKKVCILAATVAQPRITVNIQESASAIVKAQRFTWTWITSVISFWARARDGASTLAPSRVCWFASHAMI